jgi:hypothetical protein
MLDRRGDAASGAPGTASTLAAEPADGCIEPVLAGMRARGRDGAVLRPQGPRLDCARPRPTAADKRPERRCLGACASHRGATALRRPPSAHAQGHDDVGRGAALLRSGARLHVRVQPRRGGARVPLRRPARSVLRNGALGRGDGEWSPHQQPRGRRRARQGRVGRSATRARQDSSLRPTAPEV